MIDVVVVKKYSLESLPALLTKYSDYNCIAEFGSLVFVRKKL